MLNAIIIYLIILLAAVIVGLVIWLVIRRRRSFFDSLSQTLLSVRLPRQAKEDDQEDIKKEINESAQLFSLLASFKKPFALEAAVSHVGEEIHFFVAVSRGIAEAAVRQIHALWPEAEVSESGEFNIFNPEGAVSVAGVDLKHSAALPIRTYLDTGTDTFAPILSGLSKINSIGEGAAIQIIVRPLVSDAFKKRVSQKIAALKQGSDAGEILRKEGGGVTVKDFTKAITPSKKPADEVSPANVVYDTELVELLTSKISRPVFDVNIRLLASAPSPLQAESILSGLSAGFSGLESPQHNQVRIFKPRNQQKFAYDFSFRNFNEKQVVRLNSDELASLFHFPVLSTNVPRIAWLKSREAAPPQSLPASGTLIGETVFRGEHRHVFIADEDRRRHVYLVGQTGTGKSTLLKNMVMEDIRQGKGAAIIDPHGDLVEHVASLIPDERLNDVVVFNPGDLEYPVGLNMLDYNRERPEEKTFIVNEVQSIFNRLFPPETMGPMFEQYMRNALLLLMEDIDNEPASLVEVPRIFTDADFRNRKLLRAHNPSVVDFWRKEAAKAGGDAALANMTPYITSKFNNFIANDYVRPIIGQVKSAFNFRKLMDSRQILLVNLSKGRIGDLNAGLLGMIITGKILMAALSRVDTAEANRSDFNLYIDEFQNFTTDSIATILSEARKYRLNLVMAHQFIAQLTDTIREAVFGNVGSMVAFRVGASDAESLVRQFAPVFSQNDLINIDNYNAYVKLLVNGEPSRPFNIRTLPPDVGLPERLARITELSRSKYGRPRAEVEADILSRLRS